MTIRMPRLVAISVLFLLLAMLASPAARAQKCTGRVLNEETGESCDVNEKIMPPACPPPDNGCGVFFGKGDVGVLGFLRCGIAGTAGGISACNCNAIGGMKLSADGQWCVPEKPDCESNLGQRLSGWAPWCRKWPIQPKKAIDPNDKVGTLGIEGAGFVPAVTPLNYAVHFENLSTATAPAQVVVVTDQLDAQRLDLATFQLGPITFGNFTLLPQPSPRSFSGGIDLRPDQELQVVVTAALDKSTGIATWVFTSIDPYTGQLTDDPAGGFLPPNVNPPAGEGSVVFTVMPKSGLATGTAILNQAQVVFDTNAPIATPTWLNTIDKDPPVTHVLPLSTTQSATMFPVQWTGTDAGSGIRDFSIYVSDNGGAFTLWQDHTVAASANFTGTVGHAYSFFSRGTDLVGNVESAKTVADATTQIVSAPACASDVSAQVQVTRSGFGYNITTQRFVQTLTLKNISSGVITGPLSLVLDNLSSNAALFGPAGTTACAAPSPDPYVNLSGDLNPAASESVMLQFTNPTKAGITYTTRVLAGSAGR